MVDFIYKFYCAIHRITKLILGKIDKPYFRMVSIDDQYFLNNKQIKINGSYINDIVINKTKTISKNDLYPTENIVEIGSNKNLKDSFKSKSISSSLCFGFKHHEAYLAWNSFIDASIIPKGYKNSGLHNTGYISDKINEWCLPSWIWTNAALVRMYCEKGNITKASEITNVLMKQQLNCGGWIVRNDYTSQGSIPTLAPNDSAYIANNAFIKLFKLTNNFEYLEIAKKCADWIIEDARTDGLVWSGYDVKNKKWLKNYIIVDTGFTAALFANLYEITKDIKYRVFLEKFVNQFIDLFFNPSKKGFSTSIDSNNNQIGGTFARGQAWALEGLIPAYRILKTNKIKEVIKITISNLLKKQLHDGGWSYNFSRPLLGKDCKGVSIIAKSLIEWNNIEKDGELIISAQKALDWCVKHTAKNDVNKGGIFSFCMEGAVVHSFYTKTAFVYSSAYAIELYDILNN